MVSETGTTTIHYARHSERVDLSGRDLISAFGKTKAEIASSIGLELTGTSVRPISVASAKVTSMAGQIADEVHEWPNANQGSSFRSLSLLFRDGSLIALEWNFSLEEFLPKKAPWYRRWL